MWVLGPPVFGPMRWLGSLVAWLAALAQRAFARLRHCRTPRAALREHKPEPDCGRGHPELRTARQRARTLAVAAVVSSHVSLDAPIMAPVGDPGGVAELEQTLSLLHDLRGLLVLDLTTARSVPLEHCRTVAASWPSEPAPPTPHTRLAIVLRFEHWALLRSLVTAELALLATKGVEAHLCYEEQRWREAFLVGEVVHDVAGVLRTLRALVQRSRNAASGALPLSHWRIVLEAAASLVDRSPLELRPEALCELTCIALACDAHAETLELANEAARVADKGSVLECRALRLLGVAMMRQGLSSGAEALEDAVTLAITLGAKLEAAEALNELGLHELKHGEHAAAECRLQAAVALCPSEHAGIWTALRDGLAAIATN